MADASPTVRRRRLGLILRGMRERSKMTGEEVGQSLERSGSWVSRVETGRVGLRSRDLNDLLELYKNDDQALSDQLLLLAREGKQRGWWSKFADTAAGPYSTYIGFEQEAAELLGYETLVVHGLLQTEEYARSMFSVAIPPLTGDMVERKVQLRMKRQDQLTRTGPHGPLKFWAIMDESILHRTLGGSGVRNRQLKHLLEVGLMANVTIQVVPFDAAPHPGMVGSFSLVRFPLPDDPDIVYIEGVAGDIFVESDEALWYREVFDHLRAAALSPTESRQRIERSLDG